MAAVSPFLVWYSRDATSYSWLIMLSALSFYLLLRAVRAGGWKHWALWVLATTVLVYSHYFAVAALVAQAAAFLMLRQGTPLKPWLIAQAALAPLVAGSLLLSRSAGDMVRIAVPDPVAVLKGIGTALLAAAVLLLGMSYYTGLELKRLRNDDWRGVMAVVGERRQEGDRFLCSPLHHCQVAANLYLTPSPAAAGWVSHEEGTVYFAPEGYHWRGYSDMGEGASELGGATLQERLSRELEGAGQLWILSGDGKLGNYPEAAMVTQALPPGWQPAGEWLYSPLVLELYEYQPPSGGG